VGRLQQLHELRLWKTPITDAGLGHLAGLTGLTEMCLTETRVTDDGARKLLKGLPNCTIVFGDKKLTARDAEN
jgi:hypothetical protein